MQRYFNDQSKLKSRDMAEPVLVRAVYKFKGTNNDEVRMSLNFLETSNYYVFS